MGYTVKENSKIAVEIEDAEGIYKTPTAGSSFIQPLSDGVEIAPAKELIERNVLNGSVGKTTPRTSTRSVTATLPVEMKASGTEGAAPEYDALMRSALGARRQLETEVTTLTGHTKSRLYIDDLDIGSFKVNDIVMVKEPGKYHLSPVSAVVDGEGESDSYIDLLISAGDNFSNNVVIAKHTTYHTANSGHPSLSVTKYIEDAVCETAFGCKVTSMSMSNFTTGQLGTWEFGLEGMGFDRTLTSPSHTPSYDPALPAIILQAKVFMDGSEVEVNEVGFSVENSLGFITSTASENGRISSRVTERTITGSLNPYKQDDSVANFTRFNNNTQFSLFAYAYNPTETPGEMKDVVAFYIPNCLITELGESDADGILQESISFSADRSPTGDKEELFITII